MRVGLGKNGQEHNREFKTKEDYGANEGGQQYQNQGGPGGYQGGFNGQQYQNQGGQQYQNQGGPGGYRYNQRDFNNQKYNYQNTAGNTDNSSNLISILSYFGIFSLINYFISKDNMTEFNKSHLNRGWTLLGCSLITLVIYYIVNIVIGVTLTMFGDFGAILVALASILIGIIYLAICVTIFILSIYGIVQVVKGEMAKDVLIKSFRILK